MARVYISYTHTDDAAVKAITQRLKGLGHEIISDDAVLMPGVDWRDVLHRSLRGSDAVIVFWSETAKQKTWVASEAATAVGYARDRELKLVIPVVLDHTPLPPFLNHLQAIFAAGLNPDEIAQQLSTSLNTLAGQKVAQQERKNEAKKRVDENTARYIGPVLTELLEREQSFRHAAYAWYVIGLTALVGSVAFAIWRATRTADIQHNWISIAEFAFFGAITVVLLIALSKYCFLLGKSFMSEALKNSDRRHAISFGEFYLNVVQEKFEWSEVKEAFSQWNIDRSSSFSNQDATTYDPKLLENALEIAKVLANKSSEGNGKLKDRA